MASIFSSLAHLRTTIPGLGLVLVAVGNWWLTGHLSMDDIIALLGGTGLIASEGKK